MKAMNDILMIDDLHVLSELCENAILVDTAKHDLWLTRRYNDRVHMLQFTAEYTIDKQMQDYRVGPSATNPTSLSASLFGTSSRPAIVFSERVEPQRIMAQL